MTTNRTQPADKTVTDFIEKIADEQQRADCLWLVAEMGRITGQPPVMWSGGIVGFGSYHYKYDSGREGDWFMLGFSPRKAYLSVYVLPQLEAYQEYLDKLGSYKKGKSCLNLKNLDSIDQDILVGLLERGYSEMCRLYPPESSQ